LFNKYAVATAYLQAKVKNRKNQVMTLQNKQSGPEMAQSGPEKIRRVGKSHVDYWAPKLQKRSYTWEGKSVEIPEWQVRIAHLGRREWFNTGSANKAVAAEKARKIYLSLIGKGWEATLAEFKPDMQVAKDGCAVGEFLEQVKAVSGLKPVTYEIYAKKFRSLVAGAFGIDGGKAKHDYVHGGHKAWLAKVLAVRLHRLTPERINHWKVRELKKASANPLQLKRASVTVRSILLNSKALFSPDIRRHLTLRLPAPLPFEGVALPEAGKSRYKSEINPAELLVAAKRELADGILPAKSDEKRPVKKSGKKADQKIESPPPDPRPELFKILLLALGAGLRRDEIDKLQWSQIVWQKNKIRIEITEHGGTKSAESEAEVDVDPGLLDILKTYHPKPGTGSTFVIESKVKPNPKSVANHHYRCNRQFNELIVWLRGHGLKSRNALHALRKEFGSQICAQAGIFAASSALRHSSINLTREYYIDKKQPAVFAVSKLLNPTDSSAQTTSGTGTSKSDAIETSNTTQHP
ncbi:MAG: tyrosine-type recombinase/integrase, partial [Patescibacteria group bacterium]|nr:tyrosine-type recombinase/integrase [Patescibacteria group bacterium]